MPRCVTDLSFHRSLSFNGAGIYADPVLCACSIVALQVPASGDAATQRRTERARETAVAVLTAIVITSDRQASVCLEVLPLVESGTFLCGPLLRFFRGCRQADSRWRLTEGLYMQLLQLQLADSSCLDIAVLLQVRSQTHTAFCRRGPGSVAADDWFCFRVSSASAPSGGRRAAALGGSGGVGKLGAGEGGAGGASRRLVRGAQGSARELRRRLYASGTVARRALQTPMVSLLYAPIRPPSVPSE